MGVKGLFGGYILRRHRDCVLRHRPAAKSWHYLLVDLNGIIHTSCAAVYGYGDAPAASSSRTRLLARPSATPSEPSQTPTLKDVERSITDRLSYLIRTSGPTRGVFIAIDGVAPVSKQCQQRQRRYRAAMTRDPSLVFDSNCITPGTEFLSNLSYLLSQSITHRLKREFPNLTFYLANQNVAGEGEHKAIQFIRKNQAENYSYILYGMDADLINLALASPAKDIFIVREVRQGVEHDFHWVDITAIRERIQSDMFWTNDADFSDPESSIRDFVLLGYFLGNDFLPQVKCLNIYDGAIDHMIAQYVQFAPQHGHLVSRYGSRWYVNMKLLRRILEALHSREHAALFDLATCAGGRYPDALMQSCLRAATATRPNSEDFDYAGYAVKHAEKKLLGKPRDAVMRYLEGLEWIVNYYLDRPLSWTWYYPYHYAPLLTHFLQYMDEFRPAVYGPTRPHAPVQQLLSVLPPKSAHLLPEPFQSLVQSEGFHLREQFPTAVDVDLGGCKAEWEATVLSPFVDQKSVTKLYLDNTVALDPEARKRNQPGRVFRYDYRGFSFCDL